MTEKERDSRLNVFFDSLNEEKIGLSPLSEILKYKLLVMEKQKGEIIGISIVRPKNNFFLGVVPRNLILLVVKNEYQNRGIGQKLLKKVMQEAIRRHYSYLALYVNRFNSKAIHIYLKLGFRKVNSPFMGTLCFMLLPLNLMGWLFFALLHIFFFFIPMKRLLKIIRNFFKLPN